MRTLFATAFFIALFFFGLFLPSSAVLPSLVETQITEADFEFEYESAQSVFKHFLYIKDTPSEPLNKSMFDAVLANYDQ
ncbi:hypothetical protein [Olivibacter domesticus]|uniref:Uncharacterized protein n=1 Tax=Olivibacter domesticus TaxID=407022 RepID=A0A1H7JNV4_OLID1|nr:hypothetical protein [Olivibacter domesticus]SEK75580.1 hypothetical protein SAMN05661044_01061 [Olivibacter domesticus]